VRPVNEPAAGASERAVFEGGEFIAFARRLGLFGGRHILLDQRDAKRGFAVRTLAGMALQALRGIELVAVGAEKNDLLFDRGSSGLQRRVGNGAVASSAVFGLPIHARARCAGPVGTALHNVGWRICTSLTAAASFAAASFLAIARALATAFAAAAARGDCVVQNALFGTARLGNERGRAAARAFGRSSGVFVGAT
jgi:hypothetical protein